MIMIWNLITKCSVKSCHTAGPVAFYGMLFFLFKYSYQGKGKD